MNFKRVIFIWDIKYFSIILLKNINLENSQQDIEELKDKIDEDIEIINKANKLLKKEMLLKEKEHNKKKQI